MRKAKLLSLLLAVVLLGACVLGILSTGASANDSKIPEATVVYEGSLYGESIRENLEYAATQTWKADDVLEIQFSGEDSSAFVKPDAENGVSGYILFEVPTIFREDHTKLPIVIRGMDEDRAATIKTAENGYNAANDFYFTNLTINGGAGKRVSFYAGSGKLVFEETTHKNYDYTYYYGDCYAMDAWRGWGDAEIAANKNDKGLIETGVIFGKGCTGLYAEFSDSAPDEYQRFSAVGYDGTAETNPVLYALKTSSSSLTVLTDDQIEQIKEEAPDATYKPGNIITENCPVKPWDTSTYLIFDLQTNPTGYEVGYCGARKGVSPVQSARIEVLSGGIQYFGADSHTAKVSEVYAGDTQVIFRGGKTMSNSVGIRLSNVSCNVGNVTLEIHEDDANYPTQTKFVQTAQNEGVTVYGDYYFLMTGGTIGNGYSIAKVDANGDQVLNSEGAKQWTYPDSNDGYWGAPNSTGSIVNEVRGGKVWAFYGARYSITSENTPISIVLPGTGETLTTKVSVHNKISGGEIGGGVVAGPGEHDVQIGTKAYYGACKNSSRKLTSVCNEISGGTIYNFKAAGYSTSKDYAPANLYNYIHGTKEAYPTFLCDFYGTNTSGGNTVTNIIKGYPKFNDGTTKRWIHGGARSGTITKVVNYFGGLPEYNDIFGGSSGSSSTEKGNAAVKTLINHLAFDDSDTAMKGQIWGGNGEWDAVNGKANSANFISTRLETNIYSGNYGTLRASESAAGSERGEVELNVYGGTFSSTFIPANRTRSRSETDSYRNVKFVNNIYGGTFKAAAHMGGQNAFNRDVENNIYGGTFKSNFYGGGDDWVRNVTNNIYGGTFEATVALGGQSCGSFSITNNIYGGTFSDSGDYMGAYAPATEAKNQNAGTITNNIYGGYLGKGWTYMGHRNGPATTITNHFYSGADNPCRDPENALYKYYNEETMKEGGVRLRDQIVCGSGYNEDYVNINTVETITNTFEGGLWTSETGAGADITLHGGMRWGIAGNITNNFISGNYYRVYGGSDYGYITGTITNNFGKTLAAGEEEPELTFDYYVNGGGMDQSNGAYFSDKIAAALAVDEASRTAIQKAWVNISETYGTDFAGGAGKIVNNVHYGTYHQFIGGSAGSTEASKIAISKIGSIENNIYGGTFNRYSTDKTVYAGGCYRNAKFEEGIVNNIYGGTFNGSWYGGCIGVADATVDCPSIVNTFNGGQGCTDIVDVFVYMGNGSPAYNGIIKTVINDFTAGNSYVFGGGTGTHVQPDGADFGIDTTINGGTFCGFWGLGGGQSANYTGNVRTTIGGGTFNRLEEGGNNAVAGGPRNATLVGNIELIINDGTFTADVVGGTLWGSQAYACETITGNVSTIIRGGDFRNDIYALGRAEALKCTGTVTLNIEQTAGVVLKIGGKASVDSFTANGEVIDIAARTNITVANLTGKLAVKQTEGWQAHDYLTLPAGSQYEITESPAIFGSYTEDATILVKGEGFAVAGATLRLAERVGVRVLLDKAAVDALGDVFSYEVTVGGTVYAEGTKATLTEYEGYYSFIIEGIGLNQFDTAIVISSPFFTENLETSVAGLATLAQTTWTDANWKAYADAIIELNNVYNKGLDNTMTPDAVTTQCKAEKGKADDIATASATLLMADAAGMRLTATLNSAHANLKVRVNGTDVTSKLVKVNGLTITADLYFAHADLAETFVVEIVSDDGVHMSYTFTIEAMAAQLATMENNEFKDNATAFLCYIQKAVACK